MLVPMSQPRSTEPPEPPLSPEMSLKQACESYLDRRKHKLTPRSYEMYQYHFRSLQRFFAPDQKLDTLHEDHFRNYQKHRLGEGVGASVINHELNALSQLLDLAELWHPISRYYERLPERSWRPPKVMTPEEEDRFIRFAGKKATWRTALNVALITANTTLAGCELRMLTLADLKLGQDPPVVLVPEKVKNRNRVRSVPLNAIALTAIKELVSQALERGSYELNHHLIPFRVKKGEFDPNRPASTCFIRAAFRAIGKACGLPRVTPSTFRHQAITRLLESGAPDETVRAIAGHGTEKAMKYYSHIRIGAKKAAVDRLMPPGPHKKSTNVSGHNGTLPVLSAVRATAQRLGIAEDAALELVLAFQGVLGG